jgi:hypothetical protein
VKHFKNFKIIEGNYFVPQLYMFMLHLFFRVLWIIILVFIITGLRSITDGTIWEYCIELCIVLVILGAGANGLETVSTAQHDGKVLCILHLYKF